MSSGLEVVLKAVGGMNSLKYTHWLRHNALNRVVLSFERREVSASITIIKRDDGTDSPVHMRSPLTQDVMVLTFDHQNDWAHFYLRWGEDFSPYLL